MMTPSTDRSETVGGFEAEIPVTAMTDRRNMPRQEVQQSVAVIPVMLDGGPGTLQWADANLRDVSASGLALHLRHESQLSGRTLVIGVESSSGGRAFATLRIESQSQAADGLLRIGGKWAAGSNDDILAAEKLRPRVDPKKLSFVYGLPFDTLAEWTRLGVFRRYLVDRVLLCDRCGSMPSWRMGCHVCGSGRIHRDRLVHHFACAHVDRAVEYETAEGLQCPKCRTANLIVGSDYEFIDGPVECCDCGARGGQPTMAAMCHRCHHRFSMEESDERPLYAYHVERLDPLTIAR